MPCPAGYSSVASLEVCRIYEVSAGEKLKRNTRILSMGTHQAVYQIPSSNEGPKVRREVRVVRVLSIDGLQLPSLLDHPLVGLVLQSESGRHLL